MEDNYNAALEVNDKNKMLTETIGHSEYLFYRLQCFAAIVHVFFYKLYFVKFKLVRNCILIVEELHLTIYIDVFYRLYNEAVQMHCMLLIILPVLKHY